jgi:hypothetical protein
MSLFKNCSNFELIIDPLADLNGTVRALESAFAVFHSIFPLSFEEISIGGLVNAFSMEEIVNKASFIGIP